MIYVLLKYTSTHADGCFAAQSWAGCLAAGWAVAASSMPGRLQTGRPSAQLSRTALARKGDYSRESHYVTTDAHTQIDVQHTYNSRVTRHEVLVILFCFTSMKLFLTKWNRPNEKSFKRSIYSFFELVQIRTDKALHARSNGQGSDWTPDDL